MAARKKARPAAKPPLADELLADKKRRAGKILVALKKMHPGATTELHYSNPLELLVAVILSAQCSDERVNQVTPTLFAKYRTAEDFARARPDHLEAIINSTGFYHQKARSIQGACRMVVEQFRGEVPDTMAAMLQLPGVARKTANVVLGIAFGKNQGFTVDTHVGRVAWRVGLTWIARDTKDAERIEQDLIQVFPRKSWTVAASALVLHGRYTCTARKPACAACRLAPHCPSAFRLDNNRQGGEGEKEPKG